MSIIDGVEQFYGCRVGDRLTFKAATRWSCAKATRKVNGFYNLYADDGCTIRDKYPTVRYGGWPDFVVRPYEIISIE